MYVKSIFRKAEDKLDDPPLEDLQLVLGLACLWIGKIQATIVKVLAGNNPHTVEVSLKYPRFTHGWAVRNSAESCLSFFT